MVLVALAHNIRSIFNVGTLFRCADALGVTELYFSGYTAVPPDQRISKVALSAEEHVPWKQILDPLEAIQIFRTAYPNGLVVALENNLLAEFVQKREFLQNYKTTQLRPHLLIVGEETIGLPQTVLRAADVILEIPMQGQKESLNVSVAFALAVHQLKRLSN